MKTLLHPCIAGAESFEVTVPDEWRESIEGEFLVLTRGEQGLGTIQISLAPRFYRAGMQLPDLVELADHSAAQGAHGELFERRTWRGTHGNVIAASAGAMHGDWCVHSFAILQGASLVFATYVCRAADAPGELELAQTLLRTVVVRAADELAA
jgi:hypothetical protein